jgi:hypothetical protein
MEQPFSRILYPRYRRVARWTSATIADYCRDFYAISTGWTGWLEMQFSDKDTFQALLESHKDELTIDLAIRLTYLCFFPDKPKDRVTAVVDKQIALHGQAQALARIYPRSKFIILCRDPRDNALVRLRKAQKQDWKTDYCYLALSWNYVYGLLYKLKGLLGEERFLEIKYEDLVADAEAELTKVCAFLGLPYHDAMLRYDEYLKHEIPKLVGNSSEEVQKLFSLADGLMQKPYTDKVGFWKTGLAQADADLIWQVCGGLAEKIGYQAEGCGGRASCGTASYARFWLDYVLFEKLYFGAPFSIKLLFKKLVMKIFLKKLACVDNAP